MKVVASESRVGSRMYVPPESSDTSSKNTGDISCTDTVMVRSVQLPV